MCQANRVSRLGQPSVELIGPPPTLHTPNLLPFPAPQFNIFLVVRYVVSETQALDDNQRTQALRIINQLENNQPISEEDQAFMSSFSQLTTRYQNQKNSKSGILNISTTLKAALLVGVIASVSAICFSTELF